MDEDQNADQMALEYARNYARANARRSGMGAMEPASGGSSYEMAPARNGQTMRTLIVVAGVVVVAWLWFKHRKG